MATIEIEGRVSVELEEDISPKEYFDEMSDDECKEMAELLCKRGLPLFEDKGGVNREILEVFQEILDTVHLPHFQIAQEIRAKYL